MPVGRSRSTSNLRRRRCISKVDLAERHAVVGGEGPKESGFEALARLPKEAGDRELVALRLPVGLYLAVGERLSSTRLMA